jgi:hypothetical protein
MKSTKQTATKSPLGWQEKLTEARRLRHQTRRMIFDRMALLIDVFLDAAWRERVGAADDIVLGELLDCEVDDLGFTFHQLRALREHFPDRKAWEKTGLGILYQQMMEAKAAKEAELPVRHRRVIKQSEYKEVEDRARLMEKQAREVYPLREKVKTTEGDLAAAKARIIELEAEVAALKDENAELRRRLTESFTCDLQVA